MESDAITVGIIKGSMSDIQLGHVMGINWAERVWNTLLGIHQSDNCARLKTLLAESMRF
jgi:hypothetical protein